MGGASLCVFWSCDPAGEFKTKLMVMVPTILITTRHTATQNASRTHERTTLFPSSTPMLLLNQT